jgi:hypothetical protein
VRRAVGGKIKVRSDCKSFQPLSQHRQPMKCNANVTTRAFLPCAARREGFVLFLSLASNDPSPFTWPQAGRGLASAGIPPFCGGKE